MDYTYYVDEDGKVFRLHVETDDEPWNPREDMDGNIGTMFCMHGRYKLGDKISFSNSMGMKYAMLQDAGITTEKVIKLAKRGEEALHFRLVYNRHEKMWELLVRDCDGDERFVSHEHYLEYLEEDVISAISVQEIMEISKGNLIALPLYLMDHSGISMQTSDYNDPWDSGQVGWIWSTVDKAEKISGKQGLSAEELRSWLESEVKQYSQFLEGDVYGYIIEKYEKGDWCECESVWGYYPSTNDSLRELSDEAFGPEKWTSSDPKLPEPELTRAEWIKCMTEKELSSFLFETKEKIASMDQEELMAWLQCECAEADVAV